MLPKEGQRHRHRFRRWRWRSNTGQQLRRRPHPNGSKLWYCRSNNNNLHLQNPGTFQYSHAVFITFLLHIHQSLKSINDGHTSIPSFLPLALGQKTNDREKNCQTGDMALLTGRWTFFLENPCTLQIPTFAATNPKNAHQKSTILVSKTVSP